MSKMHDKSKEYLKSVSPCCTCAALINLENALRNYKKLQKIVGDGVTCSAVVKANAYGLGAAKIAQYLEDVGGCGEFFVATIDEGIEIRNVLKKKDSKIFVLNGVMQDTETYFTEHSLIPVLVNDGQLERWVKYGKSIGRILPCILHVDTGMVRNGFTPSKMIELSAHPSLKNLDIQYLMSHFACADDAGNPKNTEQLEMFNRVCKYFPGIRKSISSTNGAFLGDKYVCDMVRFGKALYGFAVREDLIDTLYPVVGIYARIVQINEIEPGQSVGYGATFVAVKPMKVITVGMGYADGLMRKLQGFGYAYIDDIKLPMVGRVSMDFAVFDVTSVPDDRIRVGDWISLANDTETLERMAIDSGTIPHEITCRLGPRVKKIYF